MSDSSPAATFSYVARELGRRKLASLFARERQAADSFGSTLKVAFGGAYIANEAFTHESAKQIISQSGAGAMAFGNAFIANPDLVRRFAQGTALNDQIPATFYADGATGYTDYNALPARAAA